MVQRKPWTAADYEQAANAYCASLPLEHFMEALPQSTQRKITLESLDVLHERRPDIQVFSELLVQYFYRQKLRKVVPDNMVRLAAEPPKTSGSFNVELETAPLLLVLEYVSADSQRKDYTDSFAKYEKELKVPYCVMYYPEPQDLRVWHHDGDKYQRMAATPAGRYSIPELDLELAIQDGWVRYWHRGELLPLPGELLRQRDEERAGRLEERAGRLEERARREAAEAEIARLKQQLGEAQAPRNG